MARPVDPARRAARQAQIIDAGLTVFAQQGPAATTAQICAEAGIASGTFFHHFPTKDALVVAILKHGMAETQEFFAARVNQPPLQTLTGFLDHSLAELNDPRAAGIIQAVGAMVHRDAIANALRVQEHAVQRAVTDVVRQAQDASLVREDIAAGRLAAWILLIIDGFSGAVASASIDPRAEAVMLHEQIRGLLTPHA